MTQDFAIRPTACESDTGRQPSCDGLDLRVPRASVLALLGPNGAGKTTAVRILATLTEPDGGRATVAGHDVVADPRRPPGDQPDRPVRRARRAPDRDREPADDRRAGGTVGPGRAGPGRRAAGALRSGRGGRSARRDVFRRDAPASRPRGIARATGRGDVPRRADHRTRPAQPDADVGAHRRARAAGTTVLLTTQYLEEADRLADRIAVIDGGRIVAEGTATELKRRVAGQRLELIATARTPTRSWPRRRRARGRQRPGCVAPRRRLRRRRRSRPRTAGRARPRANADRPFRARRRQPRRRLPRAHRQAHPDNRRRARR